MLRRSRLRALAAGLAVAVSAAAAPISVAAEESGALTDTAEAGIHSPAVEVLESIGVFDGAECAPGRFCPAEPLRRWVMAVWLVRALGEKDPAAADSGGFADVDDGVWWAGHVDRLADLGITNGCAAEPARYCPDGVVTRAQLASFLTRAFDLVPAGPAGFTDISGSSHADGIDALVAAGIAAGCADGPPRYCPDDPVTRAETATFLARALRLVPSAEFADAVERLGVGHLVSRYTTYHSCCAPRVNNIQLFADKVNGATVPPGGSFSLNRHVGKRTAAGGFVGAGTLVGGELVNTVGGGVSQFATTFYNAMFWGGYRDVFHKVHSFYFSRYPEGIEATINWPDVDLVFRNDTAGHVLIATRYTGTSITVEFYGDNDGRIVAGDWKDGRGSLEVVAEGGPAARAVTAQVSERFDQTNPPEPLRRADPGLEVGEEKRKQSARSGWSVRVTRTIDQAGRKTIQKWNVKYLPRREIVEVHPCVLADACPEPADDQPVSEA